MFRLSLKFFNYVHGFSISEKKYRGDVTEKLSVFLHTDENVSEVTVILPGRESEECNPAEELVRQSVSGQAEVVSTVFDRNEKVMILVPEDIKEYAAVMDCISVVWNYSLLIMHPELFYGCYTARLRNARRLVYQPTDSVTVFRDSLIQRAAGCDMVEFLQANLKTNARIVIVNPQKCIWEEGLINLVEKEEKADGENIFYTYTAEGNKMDIEQGDPILDGRIDLTPHLKNTLEFGGAFEEDYEQNAVIMFLKPIIFDKVGVQQASQILKKNVLVDSVYKSSINRDFFIYSMIHMETGSRYICNTSNVQFRRPDSTVSPGIVQLNLEQRNLLAVKPPNELSEKMRDMLKVYGEEEIQKIYYRKRQEEADGDIEQSSLTYAQKEKVRGRLKKLGYETIFMYPVLSSFGTKHKDRGPDIRAAWEKGMEITVGQKIIEMKCARPYNIDEENRIVRLSSDNILILGLEPTDQVIIRYQGRRTKARVLAYDLDNEWVEITNTNHLLEDEKSEIEFLVGIPRCIREELDIPYIDINIEIERDTSYLFKKNLNIQFLPLLAMLFTISDYCINYFAEIPMPLWLRILFPIFLTILMSPLVCWFMFSAERSKVQTTETNMASDKQKRKNQDI